MDDKKPVDYSEALAKGVFNWMEHNKENVNQIIKDCTGAYIEHMAAGCMAAVGKFLDANRIDLQNSIAAAVAASMAVRQTQQWKGQ